MRSYSPSPSPEPEDEALINKEVTPKEEGIIIPKDYESLHDVLMLALYQASQGKGKIRHANGKPFEEQTMAVANRITDCDFSWGQIYKKILEIPNIKKKQKKIDEMLSIIVYAAGWVLIKMEEKK